MLATPLQFAYVAHFVFLRDVGIRFQRAAVATLPVLSHPSPYEKFEGFAAALFSFSWPELRVDYGLVSGMTCKC